MTKVPRLGGTTSWEQYRQVFDAIVLSNGWDDATAAPQLLSHLEGDVLNVALLVPMSRRTSRTGLVDALSAHYGSPGRLADYRRQFEKTTRTAGEDPSIFAIAWGYGADGASAANPRSLYSSCELRRYLDSVPPETPIRDVVDRCRVWESHADPEVHRISKPSPDAIYPAYVVGDIGETRRVAAVTRPNPGPDQLEDMLTRLLAGMAAPAPVPALVPEVPAVEKLLTESSSAGRESEPVGLEKLFRSYLSGQQPARSSTRQRPIRDWNGVVCFSCGKSGQAATRCPALDESFPFILPGWRAESTPGVLL